MKNRSLCALLAAMMVLSCNKDAAPSVELPVNDYIEYIIHRGDHAANNSDNRTTHIRQLKFSVLFDSSCIYTTAREHDDGDVNKLYGFSDCNTRHHVNSARFGWRWTGRELEIFAYCYVNSVRQMRSMGTIRIAHPADMSITVDASHYIFKLNDTTVQMPRHCSAEYADGYQLYPYFGGNETAPHDIRIWIKQKS